MSVTIETSGDAEEIVELLRQVHDEHRQRRPQWFKPFDRTAALEGQRFLLSRDGAQMFVARVEGVCVGYALVCERVREENPFRYASRSLMVDQMAVSRHAPPAGIGALLMERIRAEAAAEARSAWSCTSTATMTTLGDSTRRRASFASRTCWSRVRSGRWNEPRRNHQGGAGYSRPVGSAKRL